MKQGSPERPIYDVGVVGAGPAGAIAALTLARAGQKVIVMDRSCALGARIGETLSPAATVWLRRLGLWDRFTADGHLRSPGILSVWGDDCPRTTDHLFNPYGDGWHLDRRRFDQTLLDAAVEAGAAVAVGCRVLACRREPAGIWTLETRRAGQAQILECRWLIAASGRGPLPGRPAGVSRRRIDHLVGLAGGGTLRSGAAIGDRRLLLEAAEGGWWYMAPLPKRRCIVVYLTDGDLLPRQSHSRRAVFRRLLAETVQIQQRLVPYLLDDEVRVVAADSYLREPTSGDGWLAVGDAAAAVDPLSAEGLGRALETGVSSASAILKTAAGDTGALAAYSQQIDAAFEAYMSSRQYYYGQERRWSGSPFWRRRQVVHAGQPAAVKDWGVDIAYGSGLRVAGLSRTYPFAGEPNQGD